MNADDAQTSLSVNIVEVNRNVSKFGIGGLCGCFHKIDMVERQAGLILLE